LINMLLMWTGLQSLAYADTQTGSGHSKLLTYFKRFLELVLPAHGILQPLNYLLRWLGPTLHLNSTEMKSGGHKMYWPTQSHKLNRKKSLT